MSVRTALKALLRNPSGVAMTEFALGAPFLMFAGLYGVEQANFVLVNMKINQLATHLADNASRIGDTSQLKNRKIYESDLNDVIVGAQIQAGKSVNIYKYGRIFISSLEVQPGGGKQYIHWQRCRGAKVVASSYGNQGDTVSGMGPKGGEITAEPDDGVIFVEVRYTYQPLIAGAIIANKEIKAIAAFNVRDSRDLSQIYQRVPAKPDPVQDCGSNKGEVTFSGAGVMS
ncbi:TadE/TadG family type IV pilus assembly protein [Novosphingobium aquiterrae]|uniref:TadE/TadG family type IV pilus assembly protein n=1 Tax=Novosphingobium aquiterrae TaxID=624388 RepID=A0ABV6PH90_9SPHN